VQASGQSVGESEAFSQLLSIYHLFGDPAMEQR
jgi:hypothetical protein